MTAYERWMKEKNLEERAATLENFDDNFVADVKEYVRLLKESKSLDVYVYTKQDKTTFRFPILGYFGKLGLMNVYNEPFYTCCRYALLEDTYPELEEGEKVFLELHDRVWNGEKVISTIPQQKQAQAKEKLDKLRYLMNLTLIGLETFKFMVEHLHGEGESLDTKYNDTAWKWKEYLERK